MERRNLIKMNMRTAVMYTESMINSDKSGFFINTDFGGRIGIEVNAFADNKPLHPTVVTLWKDAPGTNWCRMNSKEDCDFYAAIDQGESELINHLAVIEALTKCTFMRLGCINITDDIIDAAVAIFVTNYDNDQITINSLEDEILSTSVNGIARKMGCVQELARELIEARVSSANRVFQRSTEIMNRYKETSKIIGEFYDKYCEQLFSIALYANDEQRKAADIMSANLINFELSEKVMKPSQISTNN